MYILLCRYISSWFHLPRTLYTWEKLHLWLISFPSRPPSLPLLFLWWLRESFLSWVHVLYRCILLHSCVVKIFFSSCLSLRGFCHLNWYPSSWWGFHLLSSPWVVASFVVIFLVSLWTHLLVGVCGNDRPCTVCLILSRLYWGLMPNRTLVFSSALPWLTHIFLVEAILKLPLLLVAQPCVCGKY